MCSVSVVVVGHAFCSSVVSSSDRLTSKVSFWANAVSTMSKNTIAQELCTCYLFACTKAPCSLGSIGQGRLRSRNE
eukprot:3422430-Amphidinium_carterae.2